MSAKKKKSKNLVADPLDMIFQAFTDKKIGCQVVETDGSRAIRVVCSADNLESIGIMLWGDRECCAVEVYSDPLAVCPEEKQEAMLRFLNQFNHEHRFARLFMGEDTGVIAAKMSLPPTMCTEELLGETAEEALEYVGWCADCAYPLVMELVQGKRRGRPAASKNEKRKENRKNV